MLSPSLSPLNPPYQTILQIRVVLNIDFGNHLIGKFIQLFSGIERHKQRCCPFFHGQFRQVHRIVNQIYGAAEVDLANDDQASFDISLQQWRCKVPLIHPYPSRCHFWRHQKHVVEWRIHGIWDRGHPPVLWFCCTGFARQTAHFPERPEGAGLFSIFTPLPGPILTSILYKPAESSCPPVLSVQTWPGGCGSSPIVLSLWISGVVTKVSTPSAPIL